MRTSPLPIVLDGKNRTITENHAVGFNTVYRLSLADCDLFSGPNFLTIPGSSETVEPLYARIGKDSSGLFDFSNLQGTENIIPLDGQRYVRSVSLYTRNLSIYRVFYHQNNQWTEVQSLGIGTNSVTFPVNAITSSIRILDISDAGIDAVSVDGSPVTAGAPTIRIVRPNDGSLIDPYRLGDQYIVGTIDNSATTVTVNGRRAWTAGNFFWINLSRVIRPQGASAILTIQAVDADRNSTTTTVTYRYGNDHYLSIEQPDVIAYTSSSTFTVSGRTAPTSISLNINGMTFAAIRSFSTQVPLNTGFNLIDILCADRSGIVFHEIRRVYRYSPSNALILTNLSPLSGTYVSAASGDRHGRRNGHRQHHCNRQRH